MKKQDKSVSLAVLGVVAVLAVVGLVLLFSIAQSPSGRIIGDWAPECSAHEDCAGTHYCGSVGKVARCLPRFQIGTRCFENSHCSSGRCSQGYCV